MDGLQASTFLALALVAVVSFVAQARAERKGRALLLCCLLCPLLALVAEPFFYSPVNFALLLLPRLPRFLLHSAEVYPRIFLKVAWIPVVCGIGSLRREPIRLELS